MKAATERKIIRWIHLIGSIPILGIVYGPVRQYPKAVTAIQWVILPLIVLSGFWLWKGHLVKKWWRKRSSRSVSLPDRVPGAKHPSIKN